MKYISTDDPIATAAVEAIHGGDVGALQRVLSENPWISTARIGGKSGHDQCETWRTLLHIVTDWPGHFPRGAETVAALVAAGANVNARFEGPNAETPLHWAASSDDVAVLDALLDHGADIEAPGAVIGQGTPLADAVAFGQWKAAKRLVERGAKTQLWQAAALGLSDQVQMYFADPSQLPSSFEPASPGGKTPSAATHAFWCACHGGQQSVAEYLLPHGADLNWIGYDKRTPLDAARRCEADALVAWLTQHGAKSAKELS